MCIVRPEFTVRVCAIFHCNSQEEVMKILRALFIIAALTLASGAASGDEWKDESGKGKEEKSRHWKEEGKHGGGNSSYFHQHGYTQLNIPEGHYPPPGECRIWYPDRPPGHQPPPIKCGAHVPAGAWLIQHPADLEDRVHVTVYDPDHPGAVLVVGEFDVGSGAFVRIVLTW